MCSSDLVGRYLGETATKTKEAIEQAEGGVLFIDEAYRLHVEGSEKDYGKEALETLMPKIEMMGDEPIMMCAGYPEEMKTMAAVNPGFQRRIGATLVFPDYSPKELTEIFYMKCHQSGFLKKR